MSMILEIDRERAVELIDKFARFFVERRLGAAAIMTFESLKPLSGIGSQALYTISPFIDIFFKEKDIQEVAALMQEREYVDMLINRVDELDEEFHREERKKARSLRKRKRQIRKEKLKKLFRKDKEV